MKNGEVLLQQFLTKLASELPKHRFILKYRGLYYLFPFPNDSLNDLTYVRIREFESNPSSILKSLLWRGGVFPLDKLGTTWETSHRSLSHLSVLGLRREGAFLVIESTDSRLQ